MISQREIQTAGAIVRFLESNRGSEFTSQEIAQNAPGIYCDHDASDIYPICRLLAETKVIRWNGMGSDYQAFKANPLPAIAPIKSIDGIACFNICDIDPSDRLSYDELTAAVKRFCDRYNAAYYAACREDFSFHAAAKLARAEGKSGVVCEDLS